MTARARLLAAGAAMLFGGAAQAGETWPPPEKTSYESPQVESPAWLAAIAGQKLMAVDGSSATISSTEGGLAVALSSPDGAAQRSTFAFVSDKLGTISDDADAGHVIGFFRETDTGIEAQFADGRTESIVANMAGGISLTVRTSANDSSCTSWYPSDHVFGTAEKRAALAAYADRLGLGEHSKKAPRAVPICVPAMRVAKRRALPGLMQPLIVVTHPPVAHPPPGLDTAAKGPTETGLIAVAVRDSQVHQIDGAMAMPATLHLSAPVATPTLVSPALSVQAQPVPQSPPPSTQASAAAPTRTADLAAVPSGNGASNCLSVDTDGASLGFRNHCAYGVQFAYCLKRSGEPAAACEAGSQTGAVAANGFAAVLADTNIKSADAEHDFRWVACSSNGNDVEVHLDRSDPPAGHCVRASAS